MHGLLVLIEELKEEHGSINAAARAMGMPQATLHALKKQRENPRWATLETIAEYRRQPLWKLVRDIEMRTRNSEPKSRRRIAA